MTAFGAPGATRPRLDEAVVAQGAGAATVGATGTCGGEALGQEREGGFLGHDVVDDEAPVAGADGGRVVPRTGFEPATFCSGGRRSIH